MTSRVGLFGGTFDPVHKGHLTLALAAKKEYHLDKVIFIPCYISPFKKNNRLTSPYHRLNMLQIALEPYKPCFTISRFELNAKDVSYTYRTITHFHNIYSRSQLYFIMGTDSLKELRSWRNFRNILTAVEIIAGGRPRHKGLQQIPDATLLKTKLPHISSSEIRRRVFTAKSITGLVPEPVKKYIFEHGLYSKSR